ncbi:MAG: pyridoxal phosphate-dependent aminotransferase [Bacillales bacterium]|jgi:aspartate/tyrosine/aromatic aminotransferase|nr:pyridoxal phosphate-dependent aminotransferase [Bacillales bacterium]
MVNKFVQNKYKDNSYLEDEVFNALELANQDNSPDKINGSIGSLYDENNSLVAFHSFYYNFRQLSNIQMAPYSSPRGIPEFIDAIGLNLFAGFVKYYNGFVTPGSTLALYMAISNFVKEGDFVLIPDIAWSTYETIIQESHAQVKTYEMFQNNEGTFIDLIKQIKELSQSQKQIVIIINSPGHNPTGFSYSTVQWLELIAFLNTIKENIILINDVAYIDYAYSSTSKKYFKYFEASNDNIVPIVTYSCSKSFSIYGLRLGVLFVIKRNNELINAFIRSAQGIYSASNTGAQLALIETLKKEQYKKERKEYINLLSRRKDLFITKANELNIPYYPHNEGFFITVPLKNKIIEINNYLIKNHIYLVVIKQGLRIALSSVSLNKIEPLLIKIKEALDEFK